MTNTRGGDPEGDFNGTFPQYMELPDSKLAPIKKSAVHTRNKPKEYGGLPTATTLQDATIEQRKHGAAMFRLARMRLDNITSQEAKETIEVQELPFPESSQP